LIVIKTLGIKIVCSVRCDAWRSDVGFNPACRGLLTVWCTGWNFKLTEMIQRFNFQLTYISLKNVKLLEHFKISKTAPICFGLQRNHHQGATINT